MTSCLSPALTSPKRRTVNRYCEVKKTLSSVAFGQDNVTAEMTQGHKMFLKCQQLWSGAVHVLVHSFRPQNCTQSESRLPLQSGHCPARGLDDESFWGHFVKSEKQVVGAGMKEISFQKPALSSLAFANS